MRRVLAILILALIAAGPAMRLECLVSCFAIGSATPTTCHSERTPGAAVSNASPQCVADALPVTPALKRVVVQASSTPPVDHGTAQGACVDRLTDCAPSTCSIGRAAPDALLPLRI